MATCADCVHVEVCSEYVEGLAAVRGLKLKTTEEISAILQCDDCDHFKNRSRFVELPDVGDYDTVTTIDEAIDHCYQIATSTDETVCAECKAEHMRLCGWLGDLKRRIAAEQALRRSVKKMPEMTLEAAIIELNRLKSQERMEIDRERLTAAVDVLKDAARYREPRKPINPTYGNMKCDCPNCFSSVYYATDLFCRKCGQALDWSTAGCYEPLDWRSL